MSSYAWVIDRDFISNSDLSRDGHDPVTVDISGPHDATPDQTGLAAKSGWPFKIYDDDGCLYYSGRCWSDNGFGDEDLFGPLDDYGMPNAGAVTIKYRDPGSGKWEIL